jgi:hypothetical protein
VCAQRCLRRLWGESYGPIDVRGMGAHKDTKILAKSVMLNMFQHLGF